MDDLAGKYEIDMSYGHCRCCLEEGHHRDITKAYSVRGAREVYADIFLDCFNVFLSTNTNLSTLICSSCVDLLRNARDFKALVLKTEEQLMQALQDSENEQMVLVNVPVAKETLDTTIGFKIQVNDELVKNTESLQEEQAEPEEDELSSSIIQEVIRSGEHTIEISKPEKQKHRSKLLNSDSKRQKKALTLNTWLLLLSSNATLFKSKTRSGYPCFYCKNIFENFDLLRQHQEEHDKSELLKILKQYSAESLVVYADVRDLKCTTCDMDIPSLKALKSHIIEIHQKSFYKHVTERVVPFKMIENSFECQICTFHFETFGAIEKHMNTHFRNYVCNICGAGFVTSFRYKTHFSTRHKEGTFLCEYCDKIFKTQMKLKVHVDYVHKMLKKLKCNKCPERFSDYFGQKKHMVEIHGERPIVYCCNVCNKGFKRRYTLSLHTKRHLAQKDVKCDICTYSCYTNTELKEHKLKHSLRSERSYACSVCDKYYLKKKSLKFHMRRHSDDRKYLCYVCDESFVHSNSLKVHMKNQHSDLNLGEFIRHTCSYCIEPFVDNNDLKTHMREHHGDEMLSE